MKKIYKWLCEKFPNYNIQLTEDNIYCVSDDLNIYIGKYISPYVGYLGSFKYKNKTCKFDCSSQQSIINNIINVLEV